MDVSCEKIKIKFKIIKKIKEYCQGLNQVIYLTLKPLEHSSSNLPVIDSSSLKLWTINL